MSAGKRGSVCSILDGNIWPQGTTGGFRGSAESLYRRIWSPARRFPCRPDSHPKEQTVPIRTSNGKAEVRDRLTEPTSTAAVSHDDATRPASVIYHQHLRQDDQPEDGKERHDNQEAHARALPRSPRRFLHALLETKNRKLQQENSVLVEDVANYRVQYALAEEGRLRYRSSRKHK
uniref:Uncharacterized protein n=1 Tax=Anopheles epiroticus TaxID=199890 RepID=A0A182P154_9DIPT